MIELAVGGGNRVDAGSLTSAELEPVVSGDNALAFDLLRLAGRPGENTFLSPYSVATALAMLLPGTEGDTASEIASLLSSSDDDAYHRLRNGLNAKLEEPPQPPPEGETEPLVLEPANSLFAQKGFEFRSEYLDLLNAEYDAGVRLVDYQADPEASRVVINDWVESQTNDRIIDLIPEGVVTDLTRLVLVNAIYFKANWLVQFDESQTEEVPFTLVDGSVTQTEMMRGSMRLRYLRTGNYAAVRLPYAGFSTSMVVIVPDEGAFSAVVGNADAAWWNDLNRGFSDHQVEVGLPRFTFRTSLGLKPILQELEMRQAFIPPSNSGGADLTGMREERILYVQDVVHQAFIAVDELGTEAAAATAVVIGLESAPPPAQLTVDRPFIVAIQHDATGEILFVGQVMNPQTEE